MRTIKTTCLYCGMIGEMEIRETGYITDPPARLHEIECPHCRRLFMRRADESEGGGAKNERMGFSE